MSVKITEKAALEVASIVSEQQMVNPILRVGINGGGCSGFEYSLNFEKDDFVPSDMDTVYEQHGVKFVVDKKKRPVLRWNHYRLQRQSKRTGVRL